MNATVKKQTERKPLTMLCLLAAVLFALLLLCAVRANAASVVASGTCGLDGDNVKWSLDSDGVLTISGKGKMDYFGATEYNGTDVTSAPWGGQYYSQIKKVVIQSGVTSIGYDAFYGCSNLKSVTIPDSVTSIGSGAFYDTALYKKSANWTNGVLYFGKHLIEAKDSLSGAYTIKAGTRCIADDAFYQCVKLTSVTIPNSVTRIGESAFYQCVKLTSVTIPNSVTSIGVFAFYGCSSLTSVTIPDSVTSIEWYAFYGCSSLTSVTIPDSVTSIGWYAFYGCTSLKSVTIPASVTSIGGFAFYSCSSLKSVTIPASVTSIGVGAFYGCSSLKTVKVLNPKCEIGVGAFDVTPATIYGYKNSTAQVYAKDNDMKFVVICNHTYGDAVYTKQATTAANGKTYKKCTKCGAAKTVSVIPQITTVKLAKTAYVYTGKVRTPTVVVKDANGSALKLNTDYKITYAKGRKECGKYAVKVTFTGKYSGKVALKFLIRMGKVTNVQQTDDKGITVIWDAVPGATGYEVLAYQKKGGKYQLMQTVPLDSPLLKNPGVPKGGVWLLKIRAVRVPEGGTPAYSAYTSFAATGQ